MTDDVQPVRRQRHSQKSILNKRLAIASRTQRPEAGPRSRADRPARPKPQRQGREWRVKAIAAAGMSSVLCPTGVLVPAALTALAYVTYGPNAAMACGLSPAFYVTILAAFKDADSESSGGMFVQASALSLAVGVVVGAAALQRHDSAVVLGLSVVLFILIGLAPLTEAHTGFLAQLTAAFTIGGILVSGYTSGPEVSGSMIAVAVPAYMSGMLGAIHAATCSPANLFPNAAGLASFSVLAGCWGASHEPPINPDLWLKGAY